MIRRIVLSTLLSLRSTILDFAPPPYDFGSEDGKVWQILNDAINAIQVVTKE